MGKRALALDIESLLDSSLPSSLGGILWLLDLVLLLLLENSLH
jgi:hypothetical protein